MSRIGLYYRHYCGFKYAVESRCVKVGYRVKQNKCFDIR